MRFDKRLEKVERRVLSKDLAPIFHLTFSDQDEIEQIAQHEAANPGRRYGIIRVQFINPNPLQE